MGKGFRIMCLSINDSLYSSVFFFLTGLHFFHLLVGLLLLSLFSWSCSFSREIWRLGFGFSFPSFYSVIGIGSEILLFFSSSISLIFWNIISRFLMRFLFYGKGL